MVVSAHRCPFTNYWSFRNLCRFSDSTIHIHVVLMKVLIGYIRRIGQLISKCVVAVLLTVFYGLVIIPYHFLLNRHDSRGWRKVNKSYQKTDFKYMG